jgi:hypothetical protein
MRRFASDCAGDDKRYRLDSIPLSFRRWSMGGGWRLTQSRRDAKNTRDRDLRQWHLSRDRAFPEFPGHPGMVLIGASVH